jgi:hypothetical protein
VRVDFFCVKILCDCVSSFLALPLSSVRFREVIDVCRCFREEATISTKDLLVEPRSSLKDRYCIKGLLH